MFIDGNKRVAQLIANKVLIEFYESGNDGKVIDNLETFTYTIFVSILGVALSTNIIELLLLPYVVIVPISLKVANHKYSVGFIAAYMNKFLEEYNEKNSFKWEKFHMKYYEILLLSY